MKIGLVCPYAWDAPGGVQAHVRDLTSQLQARGHDVSVLAPALDDDDLPDFVVSAGRPVSIPYNGSVAKLMMGPVSAVRTRRWLTTGGFDVVHVHEPTAPSISMITCWFAKGPLVVTHHTSNPKSRALLAFEPVLATAMEKASARIAVSTTARDTVEEHLGSTAVIVPNGVDVSSYAEADPLPPDPAGRARVVFLGRIDEPRKGLATLLKAVEVLASQGIKPQVLVAGPGDLDDVIKDLAPAIDDQVELLGAVTEEHKRSLLRSADVFVAPNLGGESFGIILVEAMAAGAAVLASDLESFAQVLQDGDAGWLFPAGDAEALAVELKALLEDPGLRASLAGRGRKRAEDYDWPGITEQILAIYATVVESGEIVGLDPAAVIP